MKILLSGVLLLSSISAFATSDSLISVDYARVSINGDSVACNARTIAWDGISTNAGTSINLAITAVTNPQKVYGVMIGEDMIDINYLTQYESDYKVEAVEDWNTGEINISLNIAQAGADQVNILYYLILKNAFAQGATKVKMKVIGADSLKSELLFPLKTKWPVTKTSPVYKKLSKEIKKQKILTDC